MGIEKEQFEELCSAFALGALDKDEVALFDEALNNGGDEFRKIFRESIGVSYLINGGIERVTPSSEVKSTLLRTVKQSRKTVFSISLNTIALSLGFVNSRFGFGVSLVFMIIISGGAIYLHKVYRDLRPSKSHVVQNESIIVEQQHRLTEFTNELEQNEFLAKVLHSPNIERVVLKSLEINSSDYGNIFWDPTRKTAVLHILKITKTSPGNDYQLWIFDKNINPISAGVFNVSTDDEDYFGISQILLSDDNYITAFAVTIEPKGGAPHPTGTIFLTGAPAPNN